MMGPDSIIMARCHKSGIVSMYEDQVRDLMDPPEGVKPIERKWIYQETDVDDLIHKRLDWSKRSLRQSSKS